MPRREVVAFLLIVSLAAGCATIPRVTHSEFDDIPVPKGLTYLENRSTIIESPTVKAARLLYRGRIELTSLVVAMRMTLEASGWRSVSSTTSGPQGTTQVYEKGGNSLQVRLWEGWYFTYVELTSSRTAQAAR